MKNQQQIREERRRLREEYGDLFDDVAALLFRHDPAGINFEINANEYEPEAGTILPRLSDCRSVQDVERIVAKELDHWFGSGNIRSNAPAEITPDLWALWQERRNLR